MFDLVSLEVLFAFAYTRKKVNKSNFSASKTPSSPPPSPSPPPAPPPSPFPHSHFSLVLVILGNAHSRVDELLNGYFPSPSTGDVRFVGNHPYRGYVELFHNSVWGKLCPVENLTNLQTAVCKQLHLGPFVETYERVNQQMFGQIHDLVVSCKGNETNLAQCQKQEIPVVCSSVYTLYATCLTPIEKCKFFPYICLHAFWLLAIGRHVCACVRLTL